MPEPRERIAVPLEVTLAKLAHGPLGEMFKLEMDRVVRNIADYNTSATKAREITLKVIIKPDEKRDRAHVAFQSASKLAAPRPAESEFFFGAAHGRPVAVERNPAQEELFPKPRDGDSKVTPLSKAGDGAGATTEG